MLCHGGEYHCALDSLASSDQNLLVLCLLIYMYMASPPLTYSPSDTVLPTAQPGSQSTQGIDQYIHMLLCVNQALPTYYVTLQDIDQSPTGWVETVDMVICSGEWLCCSRCKATPFTAPVFVTDEFLYYYGTIVPLELKTWGQFQN